MQVQLRQTRHHLRHAREEHNTTMSREHKVVDQDGTDNTDDYLEPTERGEVCFATNHDLG